MACISRKFCGLASRPTLFDTRAAIGTADTPAEPINGLILLLLNMFINLAINTPAAVPAQNASIPSSRMPRVFSCRKESAESFEPTVRPRKMVTILISALREVSARRSTTPASRSRLPRANMPISGAASGSSKPISRHSMIGKTIFSACPTGRSCCMTMARSSLVVSARMIGG
ncbi:hypothetical protein D3C86_1485670 [compost metagenome]